MTNFTQWKIQSQVSVPIIFVLTLLILVTGVSWTTNKSLSTDIELVGQYVSPASIAVLNADRDLYQSLEALEQFVFLSALKKTANPELLTSYQENQQQAYDRMIKAYELAKSAHLAADKTKSNAFMAAFDLWKSKGDQVVSLTREQKFDPAIQLMVGSHTEHFNALRDYYDKLGEDLESYRQQVAAHAEEVAAMQKFYTIVICLAALVISTVFLLFVPKMITDKLHMYKDRLHELSQSGGDLTLRLPMSGRNELSLVGQAINEFIGHLHQMLSTIRTEVMDIDENSKRLNSISQETSTTVSQQSHNLDEMAHSVSELNTAISEVASQAQLSSDEANHAKSDVSNSHQEIQHAIEKTAELVKEMEDAAEVVGKLEKDSQNITSVVDVIRGIAEQTNLLALNAAIEAARAGESGRGFAVVADEVRALAQKTQESTESIQDTLTELNAGVDKAVLTIKSSSDKVLETSNYTDSAGNAMNVIIDRVNSITDFSVQIAAATEEQSTVVNMINGGMDDLRTSSLEVNDNAQHSMRSIESVIQAIHNLSRQVQQFKL